MCPGKWMINLGFRFALPYTCYRGESVASSWVRYYREAQRADPAGSPEVNCSLHLIMTVLQRLSL